MKHGPTRNLSASVRTRLLSLAQGRGEDYQRVLGRYAIELLVSSWTIEVSRQIRTQRCNALFALDRTDAQAYKRPRPTRPRLVVIYRGT